MPSHNIAWCVLICSWHQVLWHKFLSMLQRSWVNDKDELQASKPFCFSIFARTLAGSQSQSLGSSFSAIVASQCIIFSSSKPSQSDASSTSLWSRRDSCNLISGFMLSNSNPSSSSGSPPISFEALWSMPEELVPACWMGYSTAWELFPGPGVPASFWFRSPEMFLVLFCCLRCPMFQRGSSLHQHFPNFF